MGPVGLTILHRKGGTTDELGYHQDRPQAGRLGDR